MDVAIRCTQANCPCEGFAPGGGRGPQLRTCRSCSHGWVSHALDKLLIRHPNQAKEETLQVNTVFDVASLILFGTDALPIRLKMLLDRLFQGLSQGDLLHILNGFCWTFEDFAQGYKTKDPVGAPLMRWTIVNKEEESLVMQQFLRFSETKSLAQALRESRTGNSTTSTTTTTSTSGSSSQLDSCEPSANAAAATATAPTTKSLDSDIRKFIESAHNASKAASSREQQHQQQQQQQLHHHHHNQQQNQHHRQSPHQPGSGVSGGALAAPGSKSASPSPRASPLNRLQSMQPFDFRRASGASKHGHHHHHHHQQHHPNQQQQQQQQLQPPAPSLLPASAVSDTPTLHSSSLTSHGSAGPTRKLSSSPLMSSMSAINLSHYGGQGFSVNSDLSITDDEAAEDDDNDRASNFSESAINLSQGSAGYELKERSRKSSNPMKRRWNPVVLSTLTTNPQTGKRRVQCHACFKTFCDKGALKIHFSAVHLREMHKCTVDGCTMMFSSRRSRNRHSANPNPKLHSSSLRRKINPHDGRSSNPFPIMSPSASSILNYATNLTGSLLAPSPTSFNQQNLALSEAERINAELSQMTSSSSVGGNHHHHDDDDGGKDDEGHHDLEGDSRSSSRSGCVSPSDVLSFENAANHHHHQRTHNNHAKRAKMYNELKREADDLSSNGYALDAGDEAVAGLNMSAARGHGGGESETRGGGGGGGGRKRKSLNPTKCAPVVSLAPGVGDYDLQYSSDSSSNDTFVDRVDENGQLLDDSKSDLDDDDDDSLQDLLDRRQANLLQEQMATMEKNREVLKAAASQRERINSFFSSSNNHKNSSEELLLGDGSGVDLSSKKQMLLQSGNRKIRHSIPELNHGHHERHRDQPRARHSEQPRPASEQQQQQHQLPNNSGSSSGNNHHKNSSHRSPNETGGGGASPGENPLRHLESLSLGPFSNLVPPSNHSHFRSGLFAGPPSLSFHAPGLGLGLPPSIGGGGQSASTSALEQQQQRDLHQSRKSREQSERESRERERDNSPDDQGEDDDQDDMDENGHQDMDGSYMSGEHGMHSVFRDSGMGPVDIPVDKENPRRCTACGKIFQNHFGVKTHYQNVHLKLMHKCTVEGCNAAFPSKRSRDRHSANLNLHRKLLSTHSDKGLPYGLDKASGLFPYPGAIRDEFLSRLYDPQGLPLSLNDLYHGRIPSLGADAGLLAAAAASFPGVVPGMPSPFGLTGLPPPGMASLGTRSEGALDSRGRESPTSSVGSRSASPRSMDELKRESCVSRKIEAHRESSASGAKRATVTDQPT